MNLKNSIYKLSFAAMIMMAMNATDLQAQGVVPAQKGEKTFTLEDLNFGGNNYRNMVAKNRWCTWWGNELVRQDVDACYLVNKTTGKETRLFGINDINQWIAPTKDIKVRALYNALFPFAGKSIVMVSNGSKTYTVDFKKHKLLSEMDFADGENLLEANAQQNAFAYLKGSNLYVRTFDVTSNALTKEKKSHDFQLSKDGSREIVYGQSVHRDEFGISKGTFWSPNGELLAFYRMDQSMVTDYPQVDIPEIGFNHPETQSCIATPAPDKYPMTGETSHKVTVGVFDCMTGKTVYLKAGDPTDRYFTNIAWSPDSKTIYMFELNRDQNHAQLVQYDAVSGQKMGVLYEEKHTRYVEPQHPLIFLPWDDSQFIYQTQRDGFNHLYVMDTKTKLKGEWKTGKDSEDQYCEYLKTTPLTEGNWLVQDVLGFNASRKEIVIASTEVSPLQTNIFSLDVKNGKRTLIGIADGTHQAKLSASGTYLIDYLTSNSVPREISILPTTGKKGVTLFTATDPLKEGYNLPEITIGTIKAADGETDLYYRLIKPVNFDPNKKYPAIIYVYGGPHAQMIHNTRFYDARGWDLYMAQQGYVMLTVDNRGSDNRGIKFENCTFRHLGVEEMKDQVEGAKFLQSLPYVDADKIGVHGWSFGGFMTTNLMLTYPDIFKVGVAGGPVIDWQFYEVMYGERYMDTPQTNPEGYKGSNLRLKAGNLKGRLEIIIGGMDPTCVPQHSISFLRACIDAGTHPDFFIYPEDGHNMMGRDRVHLHEHITRYFLDHLK